MVPGSSVHDIKAPYKHTETKCPALCMYLLTHWLLPPVPETSVSFHEVLCDGVEGKALKTFGLRRLSHVDMEL
jgi:hypothetical protein